MLAISTIDLLFIFSDHGMGLTQCNRVSSGYSLPGNFQKKQNFQNNKTIFWVSNNDFFFTVASLCYKTFVSAGRVVLDGFLTYNSSTSSCSCSLTSTQSTKVNLSPLNSIHPNYAGCDSTIRVQNGGTSFIISCFVSGTITMSPSDTATLGFDRPVYGYNSDYCILIAPGIN